MVSEIANSTQAVHALIVDDDDVDAEAIERALAAQSVPVRTTRAKDGEQALEILRAGTVSQPYLVLLDLNMPRMTGLEFLEVLRSDPTLTESIVFVVTTSNAEADRRAAYEKHVAGYVVKNGGGGFTGLAEVLEKYCRHVEFPPL